MNLKTRLKFGDSFCVLPFIHSHIDINQRKSLCCHSNVRDNIPLQESITPERISEIRQSMIKGDPVPECSDCVGCESNKKISQRQIENTFWLKTYPHEIDGWIDRHEQVSYDLRYSNLCNLTCKTCKPLWSSSWAKKLNLENVYKTWEPEEFSINPQAQKIYMAGGEPFLIKSFSKILNNVNNKSCEILINTNATVITDHMIEALRPFKNICFILSIDGIGSVIEHIREGCNWVNIQKNIQVLKSELNPSFMVNTVVQYDNVNDLHNIASWIDLQEIKHWRLELQGIHNYSYKNFTGKLSWEDSIWSRNCVKNNIVTLDKLKTICKELISNDTCSVS